MRTNGFVVLMLVALACAGFLGCSWAQPVPPQVVMLLGVDTLRPDHLGCYGYPKPTSRTIDALAGAGTLFTNMMAQRGETLPSVTSIMTSLYPVDHGARDNRYPLPTQLTYLAGVLKERGYTCGAFIGNPWIQEFERLRWPGFDVLEKGTDAEITVKVIDWLKANAGKKLFIWLFYYSPHQPYTPPLEYAKRFDPECTSIPTGEQQDYDLAGITLAQQKIAPEALRKILALYDGGIAHTDDEIAKVVDAFHALKMEPLIAFFGDHGDELFDHHCYSWHIASINTSVLHIPFFLKCPGLVPRGAHFDDLVQSIDMAPTILDLLNVPIPAAFEGRSLKPLLVGKALAPLPAFSELKDMMLSIRAGNYHFIYNPKEVPVLWTLPAKVQGRAGDLHLRYEKEELYDLSADPNETTNILATHPAVANELREKLVKWQAAHHWEVGGAASPPVLSEDQKKKLEALGYLDADKKKTGGK